VRLYRHARAGVNLRKKTVVLDSGSGFPAAISLAGTQPFRGWKAAPTTKMTHTIFKLTRMRLRGNDNGAMKKLSEPSTNQPFN
jgi:hypothetical protein